MTAINISISFNKTSGKYVCDIDGNKFTTSKKDYIEFMYKKITGDKKSYDEIAASVAPKASDKFDINTRFEFVENLINMVASGVQASAVITGQGGLGKSFTVLKTLTDAGYKDMSDVGDFEVGQKIKRAKVFTQVKGYSTAKGLYRTLFENNGGVIVFDDCDAVLKDAVALNLLKGALDSYGRRVISWNADMRDEDLPRSFNFTGKVIFISNLDQSNIDQAIRSRSMMIDLSMSSDQKIDRMQFIAQSPEFMEEFQMADKMAALDLIRELKDSANDISLRTLIQVTKIKASAGKKWKQMAEYLICA
jgi:hypothetical protein